MHRAESTARLAPGPAAGLQRLATSDLDVPVGRIVYTLLCNERGGIEMDPTITRLADDRFLVLAPTLTQRRTEALLRNGLPADAVVITTYPVYPAVIGPQLKRTRDVPFVLDLQDPWVGEWGRSVGGAPGGRRASRGGAHPRRYWPSGAWFQARTHP